MTTLGIDQASRRFLLDGTPAFMLGFSYYAGLGAPDEFVERDLNEFRELGFNWFRVWATWGAFENNVSCIDPQGGLRQPFMDRLLGLCLRADAMGMVVDVSFSRGNGVVGAGLLPSHDGHVAAAALLAEQLKPFRNVYVDLANERNIDDGRHVTFAELRQLRWQVKHIDPQRPVTASHSNDIPEEQLGDYLQIAGVDFISPHRPRNADSPAQTAAKTQEYLRQMARRGPAVPVHYQEPLRCGFRKAFEPQAKDLLDDLAGAVAGGAAGWCFHNGDERLQGDGRPRRSFDMRQEEGRLMDQLLPKELEVVRQAGEVAGV